MSDLQSVQDAGHQRIAAAVVSPDSRIRDHSCSCSGAVVDAVVGRYAVADCGGWRGYAPVRDRVRWELSDDDDVRAWASRHLDPRVALSVTLCWAQCGC